MTNSLLVYIVDDNIPKTEDYIEKSVYDGSIGADKLAFLVHNAEWRGEHNLRELISSLLKAEASKDGTIELLGFTHPEICLSSIESGMKPGIIILDWEYGSEPHRNTMKWLRELLSLTSAFIFIYSLIRDEIPPFLNKPELDKYANRFQLFLKGDTEGSIFSSEEFIFQYTISRVKKDFRMMLHGKEINFHENGYLKEPSDILYLDSILGEHFLLSQLDELGTSIDANTIELILQNARGTVKFDSRRNLLLSEEAEIMMRKLDPTRELTYLQVLRNHGLAKLKEVLEFGIAKV